MGRIIGTPGVATKEVVGEYVWGRIKNRSDPSCEGYGEIKKNRDLNCWMDGHVNTGMLWGGYFILCQGGKGMSKRVFTQTYGIYVGWNEGRVPILGEGLTEKTASRVGLIETGGRRPYCTEVIIKGEVMVMDDWERNR